MNKSQSKYFNTAVKMDDAIIELLNEKPFEYITVSDICKRAGVNRSTFYLHYDHTRDLLSEAMRHLLDDFLSYFSTTPDKLNQLLTQSPPSDLLFISPEYLFPYLTYIRENRRVFLTALSHSDSLDFENIFHRLFRYIFDPILSRFQYPPNSRQYVMRFYLNGIMAIVCEWLKNDCRESTEELTQIIQCCIFGLDFSQK